MNRLIDLSDENITELKLRDQLNDQPEREEAAVNTTEQMAGNATDQPTVLFIFSMILSLIIFLC